MNRNFIPDGFEFISHRTFSDNNSVVITRVRQDSLLKVLEESTSTTTTEESVSTIGDDTPASDCPVCLTALSNPITLIDCTHFFCFVCISTWLKKQNSCPLCKTNISAFISTSTDKSIQFWRVGNGNCEKRYSHATLNNAINSQIKKTG